MSIDPSIYTLCSDIRIECLHVGNEQEPLLKIDSFIDGANVLKDYAININHFPVADSYYPGVRMPVPLLYAAALAKNLSHFIENFFGCDVRKIKKAASRFSMVTTPPNELSLLQRIPHIDAPSKNNLAIVHYLADVPNSGTSLYRHRESGFEYIDQTRYEPYMARIRNQFPEPEIYPVGYICGDTQEFKEIASFEAVFNRMIMYRGSSLHSGIIRPSYNFDPNPATGRLTITTFIEFDD
jgi:hypothetical protein